MWLIEVSGAFAAWRDGATVLDPTCGEGAFLEAFVALARREGLPVTANALARLHGIEVVEADKRRLLDCIRARYGVQLNENNIRTADLITADIPGRYDIIVGNPPWINFTDLPAGLKAKWGPSFIRHGLVTDKRKVLLGGSRADVAALVLKKALDGMLAERGRAAFFIPLSMFFNNGANDRFRPFPGSTHAYRVVRLWDFGDEPVFEGISTRYGAALFDRQGAQTWPVETEVRTEEVRTDVLPQAGRVGGWRTSHSIASDGRSGAWQQRDTSDIDRRQALPAIMIHPSQKPRQGVNTCGANDIFVFERGGGRFRNGLGEEWELEEALLFPLMNAANFGRPLRTPPRFILVPHDTAAGRPLPWKALARYPRAARYLSRHRETLSRRKGTLINAHIGRGLWWALLGVGPYAFAPWKVAWEALGRKSFTPAILDSRWQGNQAMHAFCPCATRPEAEALAAALGQTQVETWLRSSAMAGTCNWAQPGRIAQVLTIDGGPL
jgi:Eco57I restriction-modification methylase